MMTFGAFVTLLVSIAFSALLYWVLTPSNKTRLQSYASIPLDDDATSGVVQSSHQKESAL